MPKRAYGRTTRKKKKRRLLSVVLSRSRNSSPRRHRRDFSWKRSNGNPHTQTDDQGPNIRLRLRLGILVGSLIAFSAVLTYHPFFTLETYNISGLQRISQPEVEDAINASLNNRRYFVLPGDNYFFVNLWELEQILRSRLPIENIVLKKEFPGTLTVAIEEKISTVIYDNGDEYSYLGLDGKVVEILRKVGEDEWTEITETTSTTLADGTVREETNVIERFHTPPTQLVHQEMGNFPILYDTRRQAAPLHALVVPADIVNGLIEWFRFLERSTDISLLYARIDNGLGTASLETGEGWVIEVALDSRLEEQFDDLLFVLDEKISNRSTLQYIDLRFGERVYWQ